MTTETSRREPLRSAGVAAAEEGQVLLDGPDGVAVSMTPEAAEATARSLIAAAEEAANQRSAEAHPS